jgi:G3E family GTPase
MTPPLSLTLISGYLGVGKTTFVSRWLVAADACHCRRIALVNDFGDINIG